VAWAKYERYLSGVSDASSEQQEEVESGALIIHPRMDWVKELGALDSRDARQKLRSQLMSGRSAGCVRSSLD